MTCIFVDSNIFLQCRTLDELPWGDIGNDEILLLVPREVQKEIDRLKHDGNNRRARRARKASRLFRKILAADGEGIDLRHKNRLPARLALAPPLKLGDREGNLDLSYPDDRIVAEALAYKEKFPEEEVVLAADDTNLCQTAKHCGLVYFLVPESWLLPTESDDRDKEINRLRSKVSELSAEGPCLEIEVVPDDEAWRVDIVEFEPLADDRIEELRDEVAKWFPMREEFGGSSSIASVKFYRPPSQDSIDRYQNDEYPRWLRGVEQFFRAFPSALGTSSRCIEVIFRLRNSGTNPAEHLIVEINALGGLLLAPPNELLKMPALPDPPEPPKRKELGAGLFPELDHSSMHWDRILADIEPVRRDRFEFYWRDSKPSDFCPGWAFECEELRHQADPEDFCVTVFVPESYRNDGGSIQFKASASNLAKPATKVMPIAIDRSVQSVDSVLEKLLVSMREREEK